MWHGSSSYWLNPSIWGNFSNPKSLTHGQWRFIFRGGICNTPNSCDFILKLDTWTLHPKGSGPQRIIIFLNVIKHLIEEINKVLWCKLTKNEMMRSLAKSVRMDEANIYPQSFKNPWKIVCFKIRFLRKNMNFPNDEESSWEEVKRWKSWGKA